MKREPASLFGGKMNLVELYEKIKSHLNKMNLLPDEYFEFNSYMFSNSELNVDEDISISCNTEWGGSEGIYIDVYLDYLDKGKDAIITGKSLGETEADFDRMHYIAGEIYKYVNGSSGQYARYFRLKSKKEDMIKEMAIEQLKEKARKKLYYSGAAMNQVDMKKLGLILIIIANLQELELTDEKWQELCQAEEPLDLLYERCKTSLCGTDFEIQDTLSSCINIGIL